MELWDQECFSHQVLLLPMGNNTAGDPEEDWHMVVRTCNRAGDAKGPGRAESTMSTCSWQ